MRAFSKTTSAPAARAVPAARDRQRSESGLLRMRMATRMARGLRLVKRQRMTEDEVLLLVALLPRGRYYSPMCGCLIATFRLRVLASSLFILVFAGSPVLVLGATDIPADAPQDAIMAGPAELREAQDWASAAFTDQRPRGYESSVHVELRRQDHNS